MLKKFLIHALILVEATALLSGCGYHMVGSNPPLPENAQSIALLPIQNQTYQSGIEALLSIHIRRKLRENSSVRLESPASAQLHIIINLSQLNTVQTSVSSNGQVIEQQLTLIGQVNLEKTEPAKTIWTKRVTADSTLFYEEGESQTGVSSFNRNQTLDKLAELYATKIYEQIFYNF
ncbi:MAG: hypothetical protein HQM12_04325 [SAR324 cluster bacterium]|nr:hypothetical protein [SAR324 cluster bacterium]